VQVQEWKAAAFCKTRSNGGCSDINLESAQRCDGLLVTNKGKALAIKETEIFMDLKGK
jgi:hypothetical protein